MFGFDYFFQESFFNFYFTVLIAFAILLCLGLIFILKVEVKYITAAFINKFSYKCMNKEKNIGSMIYTIKIWILILLCSLSILIGFSYYNFQSNKVNYGSEKIIITPKLTNKIITYDTFNKERDNEIALQYTLNHISLTQIAEFESTVERLK